MKGNEQALLGTVGLCRKAGKLIIGTDAVCQALRAGKKPCGVLTANDISQNTNKRLHDKCNTYGVPLWQLPATGEALAHAVGKSAKTAAVAVTEAGLWRLLLSRLEGGGTNP